MERDTRAFADRPYYRKRARSIVNGGYLARLKQYGVLGQPLVVATDVADETNPSPANFVSKLESFIKGRIAAGRSGAKF